MLFGVDVSEHQDGMPLTLAAKEGMACAIIRTTDGTYKDRCYTSHLLDAEDAGLGIECAAGTTAAAFNEVFEREAAR